MNTILYNNFVNSRHSEFVGLVCLTVFNREILSTGKSSGKHGSGEFLSIPSQAILEAENHTEFYLFIDSCY